jgi:hypothetical protein
MYNFIKTIGTVHSFDYMDSEGGQKCQTRDRLFSQLLQGSHVQGKVRVFFQGQGKVREN